MSLRVGKICQSEMAIHNRKVVLGTNDASSDASRISLGSRHSTRFTFHEVLQRQILKAQEMRAQFHVYDYVCGESMDVTPKPITVTLDRRPHPLLERRALQRIGDDSESFRSLRSGTSSLVRGKSGRALGIKMSIDDIIIGIGSDRLFFQLHGSTLSLPSFSSDESSSETDDTTDLISQMTIHQLPFISVRLTKTHLFQLYNQLSITAMKNTDDGEAVEKDNRTYDYLTIGRGRVRRRSDAECQTLMTLKKSRDINTTTVTTTNTGTFVSYYEMYDTYEVLDKFRSSWEIKYDFDKNERNRIQKLTLEEQFPAISRLRAFDLATMIVMRVLAGNEHGEAQKRFRKMNCVDRMVKKIDYNYSLDPLFVIYPFATDVRRAVCDISFCYSNSDILAVAYGIYSYSAAKLPKTGVVCVWSIKNPCDPERYFYYDYPVGSVEFSPYRSTLLAIGLYDGTVQVRDLTSAHGPLVAVSERSTSPGVDPVLAIKWIQQPKSDESHDIDPILSLSQDGSVTKFNIINSPYLVGFKQALLERVEGTPEGIPFKEPPSVEHQANRRPQGLCITKHPLEKDIFYVLTDEGCLHKCSTNYQNLYLELVKTHVGAVNSMDFSPWSPKLFLTCGNDWCIRIWMDGILTPLITLKNLFGPYQWAAWSRTHSTIIIGLNRKHLEIWDIRRTILKPMSTSFLESSFNTTAKFSLDGYCIAIGNEKGNVHICAFDGMPFPSYFQYDTLEKAIHKALISNNDLLIELKSVGYFGYPNKGFVMPP
uniref:Dynein axonemal intermediate chain 4 n=1 Tax=Glossina palpalis gambiensis TaxID=67801 RepID=A0A1B0C359_9MUSC